MKTGVWVWRKIPNFWRGITRPARGDACEHFHLWAAHAGKRKVGGRAAEHVGQDSDTIAAVDAIYRFDDITSTQFGLVLGSNRDGFNLFLRTHNVFERRPELVGKAPMGHNH